MNKHGAIIQISIDQFLKMLDFEGGIIHSIKLNDAWLPQDTIVILLEHSDLPEIQPQTMAEEIKPIYQNVYGNNGCLLRVERINPAKLNVALNALDNVKLTRS